MKSYRDANRRMLITNVSWKRRRKRFDGSVFLKDISIYLYFALSVIWLELIFHIRFFDGMNVEMIHAGLFSVCLAMIPAVICSLLPKKAGSIVAIIFSEILFALFTVQAVYYEMHGMFLTNFSASAGTAAVIEEPWKAMISALAAQWLTILLYAIPLLFLIIIGRKLIGFGRVNIPCTVIVLLGTVLIHVVLLFTLKLYGTDVNDSYYIYNEEFVPDASAEKLGLMTTMRLDLKKFLVNDNDDGA